MEFTVNAGGLVIKHNEDQLLSLIARLIVEGKPGTGFFVNGACIAKNDDGEMVMGRSIETVQRLINETSDDILARVKRWSKA